MTPKGGHPKLGTANHCIMLRENTYFELLTVVTPQPLNADFTRILESREGIGALALKTDDARAAEPKLAEAGLGPQPAVDFARPVDRPGGQQDARFTAVHLDGAHTPGGRAFLCQHHTPELVWLPEYLTQANGALGVMRLTLVASDPGAAAKRWATVFGAAPQPRDRGFEVSTGNAAIRVLSATDFASLYPGEGTLGSHAPAFAALGLKCRSIEETAASLTKAGIGFDRIEGGLRVPSAHAAGAVIEFLA
jgi:hypothetical protein